VVAALLAASAPLVAGPTTGPAQAPPRPAARLAAGDGMLVLTRTRGFRHASIPAAREAVAELGREAGLRVVLTEATERFTDRGLRPFRVVVFLLTTGDVLAPSEQRAFERWMARGGGWVGVHSAADTEYDWPYYGGLVGAWFNGHPPVQRATVVVEDRSDPSTAHLPARWSRTDEWYAFRRNPRADVHVLATLDERSYEPGDASMGADHPIAWRRSYRGGRAWYTAMGHTAASYREPRFRRHLLGGIRWAAAG
jgi:type 1 glutamine amidotransferase